jgi:hypothetical protein
MVFKGFTFAKVKPFWKAAVPDTSKPKNHHRSNIGFWF